MEDLQAFLRPIAVKVIYLLAMAACIGFMHLTKDTVFFEGTSFATNGNALGFAALALLVIIFFTREKVIPNPISGNDNRPLENSKKPRG